MSEKIYDIIVIGAGSGGLTLSLSMVKVGLKILIVSKSDNDIGGDCLNDGCVPSKALIHVSKILYHAGMASHFGLEITGKPDMQKAISYIYQKQEIIRKHENAQWLEEQGMEVALGEAKFVGKNQIEVSGKKYSGKKIVIATGSKPRKLKVPGVEMVNYFDNENIFHCNESPEKLLVIGGGPIGIELGQAMNRLGSKVTLVEQSDSILEHDDVAVTNILLEQLKKEGITFLLNAEVDHFISANEAHIKFRDGKKQNLQFDSVFVAIGREPVLDSLQLNKGGIEVNEDGIIRNRHLRTTNKDVFVCGDVAGDLQFSHAAEFQARILINNFFSPFNKKLKNDHMSWVTFTDPELATFGLNEKQLKERNVSCKKLELDFADDDRAVIDEYRYGKMILYISKGGFLKKKRILGGTMIAPNAGEIIQELILSNSRKLSINAIFNKIYPYPVASRINQQIITKYKEQGLTKKVRGLLRFAFKIFN